MKEKMLRMRRLLGMVLVIASCTTVGESKSDDTIVISENTPLSAIYHLDKVYSSPIKIHVKGKTDDMDIIHCAIFDTTEIPIHGLYQNYENTVILTIEGQEITNKIRIADLGIANAVIHKDNLPVADPENQDLYFSGGFNSTDPDFVAYDRKGDVRYYNNTISYCISTIYHTNGQMRVRDNDGIKDLFGNTIVNYKARTDFSVHHDSTQVRNGNYVVLVESEWGGADRVVEIDSSGNIKRDLSFGSLFRDIVTFDLNPNKESDLEILNKIVYDDENPRIVEGEKVSTDWAHANSVVYNSSTDTIYFSLRNQGVIAVWYTEWDLMWWMADDTLDTLHEGVPNRDCNFAEIESLKLYRATRDGAIDGPKNQHALFLLENGNLGMFDNAGDEDTNPLGSRYVEYDLNVHKVDGHTAAKVGEYRDPDLYSRYMSDVDFTGEGHLLMTWGDLHRVREIDTDFSTVLFDMQIVNASGQMYRSDKMPLYPYMDKNKAYAEDNNLRN